MKWLRAGERLPAVIQTSAGVAAISLGLVVLAGWQTGSSTLTQVRPGLPAMQYVTALAFALAGVGLLSSLAAGRESVAGIAGLLISVIGALSLIQDLLYIDPRLDLLFGARDYLSSGATEFTRMPPNESLCFALVGAALFIRRAGGEARMSMATSLLGSVTAAIGLVAVIGYASDFAPAYGVGRLTRMALHTAAGLLVVGCGLVASGWRDSPAAGGAPHRIPTLVGVASLTVAIAVWHGLLVHDRERSFELIRTHAAYLGSLLTEPLELHARAIERMALGEADAPHLREQWEATAHAHMNQFAASYALEHVNLETHDTWRVPDAPLVPAHLRDHALQAAVASGETAATHAIDLPAGASGFLLAVPVVESGRARTVIVGAVRLDTLAKRALGGQEQFGYEAALFDGVRQIYGRPGQVSDQWMTEVDVSVRGTPFRLRVWPTPARAAQLDGQLPSLILAGGLLLSAVLACLTFFAGTLRRREQQLREAADQLRQNVKEREAAEAAAAKARDIAQESDRLKSEFVANVSHELRTPMNGILGLTDLLLDTHLTAEQREHAVTVRECGETLLELLNDILDLSKVAAGKLDIQSVGFEPRHLLQQTCDLFAARARRKGIELVCLVHHDVPGSILGDPGRLRQVLTNLLGNAVKFTDRGEITVRATCEPRPPDELMLRVEVSDTGIGISPEAQAQIFQPFVQADGSITRKYGGTGLGLVISRQLAQLMGGEMGMSSEQGRGSTFWFSVRTSALTPAQAIAPSAAKERGSVALEGVRTLVLDDFDTSRERLRAALEERHMTVTTVAAPDAALQALTEASASGSPYDVLIVDLRAGTTVLDFAAAAQGAGLVHSLRMILMSNRGQRGDAQEAQRLGASAYLTKPISTSDLLECIATVLRARPQGPEIAAPALVTRYTLESRQRHYRPLLLVEDNVVNQKVMMGYLAKLGYRADLANNGIEALDALQRYAYPMVLMDSQMPEMDGFATTAEIRRREGSEKRTIVVAVTAHAMAGERERCLAAGMDDYLSKPVSLERLSAIIERWLPSESAHAGLDHVAPAFGPGDAPTLDTTVLAQLRDLEADVPGLVVDVVSTFLRETPGRIERLRSAIAAGDGQGAGAAAHGLKGSAGSIGASRLADLCADLERRAGTNGSDCSELLQAVAAEFDALNEVLLRDYCVP